MNDEESPLDRIRRQQREASKRWRDKNKDKVSARNKAFREANPEYVKQKKREHYKRAKADPEKSLKEKKRRQKWYDKNKEKLEAYNEKYAIENAERLKQYRKDRSEHRVKTARAWQIANKERYDASQKKWRDANMHILRKHIALRRARIMNATIGDPKEIAAWEKEWKSRETNVCEWCRMEVPTSICETDHAEPLINGGAHNLDNLVIACKPCNNKKRGKPLSKWLDYLERQLDKDSTSSQSSLDS